MSVIQPLDLEQIFITNLAGNPEIFSFVAIIFVGIACAYFRFSNRNALAIFALFTIIMATYMQGIYVLVILLTGISSYYALSRIAK